MKTILINFRAFFGEFKKNIMPKHLLFLILTAISLSVFGTSCTSKSPPSTSKSPSPTSTSSCPSFFLNGKAPEITNPKLTPKVENPFQ